MPFWIVSNSLRRSTAVDPPSCGSYSELVLRLYDLFDKWLARSDVPDFGGLRDLVVREQLLTVLPIDARRFVAQQAPLDAAGTAQSADTFLRAKDNTEAIVAAASKGSFRSVGSRPVDAGRGNQAPGDMCQYCGGGGRHSRNQCPARNQRCRSCQGRGHLKRSVAHVRQEFPEFP